MYVKASISQVFKNFALTGGGYKHQKQYSKILLSVIPRSNFGSVSSFGRHYKSLFCMKLPYSFTSKRQIRCSNIINEKEHFRESESASYEGTGRTTVTILNEDVQYIMIDSISLSGFRLNTGVKAYGPLVVFPNAVLSWRVMDFLEVNERSLSLFTLLVPKPDIVILGYGDRLLPVVRAPRLGYDLNEEESKNEVNYKLTEKRNKDVAKHIAKLTIAMKQKKITLECYNTEDAVSAYNYLVSEDRLVAAALIPPNVIKMTDYQKSLTSQLAHGEDPWEVTRDEILLAADKNNKHHIQSVKDSFMKKEE